MSIRLLHGLAAGTLAIAISALAQQQPQPQPQQPIRRPDGGTSGSMESIFIAPKPGAPFSFTLHTDWTRPLGNGGTFTLTNERYIVRDGRGRIYQERWMLVPKGGQQKSVMTTIQITDPEQHTWYNRLTFTKVCDIYRYSLSSNDVFVPFTAPHIFLARWNLLASTTSRPGRQHVRGRKYARISRDNHDRTGRDGQRPTDDLDARVLVRTAPRRQSPLHRR